MSPRPGRATPTRPATGPTADTALNSVRRSGDLRWAVDNTVDVLVVGLGVTGAGLALDAASRGLSVLAVDAHDLAFGTSRWSSKLVHGGLRYLAKGQVGVAHQSAMERGILMTRTAPHLVRALPMVLPLTDGVPRSKGTLAMLGFRAGDGLRAAAHTPRAILPRPRRLAVDETVDLVPVVRRAGLRGGLLSYDGQLIDDARLVASLARTAAGFGARILTRVRVSELHGTGASVIDGVTGETLTVRARSTVNATGVWAADLVPGLTLSPSRGTHLVVRSTALGGVGVAISAPVPGSLNRFVFSLPQPDGTTYIGLTDEPVTEVPEVPQSSEAEIDFLLAGIGTALERPLTRADVIGTYAGLRPLLSAEGSTADLSRKHAVLTSASGVVTVVGGKLTTYRQMAEDGIDAVVAHAGLPASPCRTRDLPLLGAASRSVLADLPAQPRLVQRYGTEATTVTEQAIGLFGAQALEPIADNLPVTRAELLWGVTHEGALDVDDLLDRRTRIGLVAEDRAVALPVAVEVLAAGLGLLRFHG